MPTKHTASIAITAARVRFDFASQECVHWDYESDGDAGHRCCDELHEATVALRRARKAMKAQEESEG